MEPILGMKVAVLNKNDAITLFPLVLFYSIYFFIPFCYVFFSFLFSFCVGYGTFIYLFIFTFCWGEGNTAAPKPPSSTPVIPINFFSLFSKRLKICAKHNSIEWLIRDKTKLSNIIPSSFILKIMFSNVSLSMWKPSCIVVCLLCYFEVSYLLISLSLV